MQTSTTRPHRGKSAPGRRVSRRAAAVLAAVSVAAFAGACGSGSDASSSGRPTITYAWWGDSSRAQLTEAAVKLFEKRHPDVTVKTQYSPFGDYEKKLATQTAGGSAPDLMTVDRGFQNEYAQRGVFLDLGKYSPSTLNLTGFDAKFGDSGKTGGTLFAVPMAQNTQAIVVDVTRLQSLGVPLPKPGWTWTDLQGWAKTVSTKSHGKIYGFVDPGTLWPAFTSWLIQRGKSLYSGGKLGFTKGDLAGFWNYTTQLRKSGAATNAQLTATVDGLPTDEPLLKGSAAAEWDYDSLFTMYASATKDKLELVSLPTVDGKTGMFAGPSMMLAVSAHSQYPKQAVQLMNFLVNDPAAAKELGTSRGMFPNLKVRKTLATGATGATKVDYAFEAANQPNFAPTPPAPLKGDSELLTLMQRTYQQVAFGQLSVDAAAAQFMSQAQQTVAQ